MTGREEKTDTLNALENLNISSIKLPSTLERISGRAFRNCAKLVAVTLPEAAVALGYSLFEECNSLQVVKLNKTFYKTKSKYFNKRIEDIGIDLEFTRIEGPEHRSECRDIVQTP